MSVRVVARIRPLLKSELDKDVIVTVDSTEEGRAPNVVKIPSPKNEAEEFSFAFNSVYDQQTSQEELFTAEVAPHLKALFQGLDLTIFAYGVTGTGKTHTMRGGLKLAERGVIPRLLSGVFRRGKKIARDTGGETTVEVALSYYEIYNDKVYDLLEPPEKRTPAGLPLREKDGKTIVVGLSERSCQDLKDFETLYIEANTNRVTAATKLNAHSSRSHAILRVKVTQTTGDTVLCSTASAIDLAGSEDNRRTDNGKERLVESAAINKSLFVLSQCIDAISRGDKRIPYRESKMTRILSLGQNNGITIMILNLAPLRSYHLDTLSSLNVSSRAKRIEVREIENEVVFKTQPPRTLATSASSLMAARQPLRPLANAHNVHSGLAAKEKAAAASAAADKPVKAFAVYTDRAKPPPTRTAAAVASNTSQPRRSTSITKKRPSDPSSDAGPRPSKLAKPTHVSLSARPAAAPAQPPTLSISAAQIEAMVERKVGEILASRAAAAAAATQQAPLQAAPPSPQPAQISEEVARRLEALERRIDDTATSSAAAGADGRSEGLRLLLRARQAKERGDDAAALRCYEAALPFFPGQAKLLGKIAKLRERIAASKAEGAQRLGLGQAEMGEGDRAADAVAKGRKKKAGRTEKPRAESDNDGSFHGSEADADVEVDDESFAVGRGGKKAPRHGGGRKQQAKRQKKDEPAPGGGGGGGFGAGQDGDDEAGPPTPRTRRLLAVVNSRDVARIRALHGFGAKKARDLVDFLELRDADEGIRSLAQLRLVPGLGGRAVERAYEGLVAGGEE